jgi:hypothetical protein
MRYSSVIAILVYVTVNFADNPVSKRVRTTFPWADFGFEGLGTEQGLLRVYLYLFFSPILLFVLAALTRDNTKDFRTARGIVVAISFAVIAFYTVLTFLSFII